jgi:hypothetical protein
MSSSQSQSDAGRFYVGPLSYDALNSLLETPSSSFPPLRKRTLPSGSHSGSRHYYKGVHTSDMKSALQQSRSQPTPAQPAITSQSTIHESQIIAPLPRRPIAELLKEPIISKTPSSELPGHMEPEQSPYPRYARQLSVDEPFGFLNSNQLTVMEPTLEASRLRRFGHRMIKPTRRSETLPLHPICREEPKPVKKKPFQRLRFGRKLVIRSRPEEVAPFFSNGKADSEAEEDM